jgi:sugar/nucleoside kinase (ribokinase family)
MSRLIKISGTGCALVDYLYKPVNFISQAISPYLSAKAGDGGLAPGKLVFTEELEIFANEKYLPVRDKIVAHQKPVAHNIGGPSIVSLIHAAQLLHQLPVEVRFWGCKGNDEGGVFLDEKLRETPLKIGNYKIGERHTPFTDVFSDPDFDHGNGERIFVNNIGAAWEFLPEDLDESFFDADIVVFGGTALVPAIHDHLTELLLKSKEKGCITIVNTVYDFRNEKANPQQRWPLGESDKSYGLIDLLITDYEEALRLSGEHDIQRAIRFFLDNKVSSLIITNGSKNSYAYSDGRFCEALELTKFPVSKKVTEELKSNTNGDTTGCGDNFVGGVIASLATQLNSGTKLPDLEEACCWGVISGGYTCFYIGGTYFEDFSGEKLQKLKPYYERYKQQLAN